MNKNNIFLRNMMFILISSIGGYLLSLTGLSIGWMIGSLIVATLLSYRKPNFLQTKQGISKFWICIGQCLLGIELGQKINLSVMNVFMENSLAIIFMLIMSIVFSILSGYVLWKFSKTDMLTSFYGTAPGGLTAMPSIAEEVGANTAIVSIIQTIRVFLVILMIPMIVSYLLVTPHHAAAGNGSMMAGPEFQFTQLLWTFALVFAACGGAILGEKLKLPAPWTIGSMLGVALFQTAGSSIAGHDMVAWWPHTFMVLAQILIAASIGAMFHKEMLIGLGKIVNLALICTVGFILAMFGCSFIVSELTEITFVTATLAFAPGGIAEMATTSVLLNGDSTFVVAVQVLRIFVVLLFLPPCFKLIEHYEKKKVGLSS
ncbi:AbrB family transcriptional regulator [Bacillus sp. Marseille-Q3570]|uniref:AbrB family transcriptional regulator n=1 Tax=Bacillus sp. Marseille-Q3570 TaxID=2963522 RepID=UPI0021B844B5|nr:AbrB family transcriptional regulator [Bacillus sp. Marseille-Q3570]